MLYIGVDLGTSACKFLLVDETGKVCNQVSREYPLSMPHTGWSEQDPPLPGGRRAWMASRPCWRGSTRRRCRASAWAARCTVWWPWTPPTGCCARPSCGTTAAPPEQTDYLNKEIGRETLSKYTGNIAFAGFTAPKILWMKENEPELYAAIAKIMLPKDYLVYRMTGVHATDYSDASGMLLLDVEHKCWSKEMCEICGVKEEWLAHLYESWQFVGTLKPDAAAASGSARKCKGLCGCGR